MPATEDPINTASSKLALPARAAILGGLFFIEKMFLTRFVDLQRADAAIGVGGDLRLAQHIGFRFIVAFVAAAAVFAFASPGRWKLLMASAPPKAYFRWDWAVAHFTLIACLAWLGTQLFPAIPASIPFVAVICLWLTCGAAAFLSAVAALGAPSLWLRGARTLGSIWFYAAAGALAAVLLTPLSQGFWSSTTATTFNIVRLILQPILPGLSVDPETKVIGTQNFAVAILDYCSGVEGMSLILVFTIAWLWFFRKEYRFPRALLLIPIGMALMFALNAVRLVALVLIGNAGYPEVAEFGFHSQAGWITFNLVAVGIAFWARRSRWLSRNSAALESRQSDNPTAAYLMPLLAILAAGMLSHALSGRFEWFYPVRVFACVAILVAYRRSLREIDWRWSWRGPLVGVGVFIVWMAAVHLLTPHVGMPQPLAAATPGLRWSWIVFRIAGTVLTVPIAEELAYRGFLMRRLQSPEFDSLPYERVRYVPIAISAIVFGGAHGILWLPGIFAGLAYALIVKSQGRLGEAVTAHMTTNSLVVAVALMSDDWSGF